MAVVIPIRPMTHAKRQAIIDEFGELQEKVDAFKPTRERHANLRELIAGWYEKCPETQPYLELGQRFTLQVSECSNERSIFSMAKLFRRLGVDTFLKLCKFPLAAVDTNVPAEQHEEFLAQTQTGPRKIKVIPGGRTKTSARMAA